jgi:hypothetical protein
MKFQQDTRGLGLGILGFVAIIVIGALLYTLLDPAAVEIFSSASSQTSDSRAQTAINRRETIWNLLLYATAFLGILYIIARSLFESRSPQ